MEQEKFEIWMMGYLSGELDENGQMEFENYLKGHPSRQKEFDAMNQTWNQMDSEIPDPSQKMDEAFFDMLNTQVQMEKDKPLGWLENLRSFFGSVQKPQLAFGMLLLGIGISAGYFLNTGVNAETTKETIVTNSKTETEEVREQLVLTLLDQPSANKRLQGISEVNKITKVDEKVIKALLKTLDNDPNVNVRLVAIESLTNYLDNPIVREGLVQSIVRQDSPIVQVTLANLMVALQEKKSIEPFKTLMRSKELNQSVKQKLETSIKSII